MVINNAIDSQIGIQVSLGGTGQINLPNYNVLVGNGASAITTLTAGSSGQVLIGATSANPAFNALTSTQSSLAYSGALNIDVFEYTDKTSWTPGISFGGTSVGITYTTQTGHYSKFGQFCVLAGTIVLSSKGSSTGYAQITNLPFQGLNITATSFVFSIKNFGGTAPTSSAFIGYVGSGTTTIILFQQNGVNATNLADTNFSNTTQINFSGYYRTNG